MFDELLEAQVARMLEQVYARSIDEHYHQCFFRGVNGG